MRVAIIGAGAAGLTTAKHVASSNMDLDVFEMNEELGGTWSYTDDVGEDRYGYPVYSAMYKGLRTNLPKEIMGFSDFDIPAQENSYLTQAEILDFLKLYADTFDLIKYIKFNTMVMDISPVDDKWKVTTVFKPTKKETTDVYDSVIICNGHYNDPIIPTLQGQDHFTGIIDHSRNYREPEKFRGKRVLVIGAGPSGIDLTLQVSTVAEHVTLSHHVPERIKTEYPPNVYMKPDVQQIVGFDKVEFVDGSCCCYDAILFCTGYRYSFPFLSDSCGLTVDDYHVRPLYKHMIHIDRPTMCFIGVPYDVCTFLMFDLQARYVCKYLTGDMDLPSKEEMRLHTEKDVEDRIVKGYTKRQMHRMGAGPNQQAYYDDLGQEANIATIPSVMVKIWDAGVHRLLSDLIRFRGDKYRIVDENNFVQVIN
ncbi:unnamed protein product [Ceutorhynchus assimilis]|uniref:Flavin-containing monooxygenase n=1 Tax=Ceutorhynchus assimilis TaxID=467358 RepID=A0A9N9QDT9_9CUCU|nr:unnamed protein product [Ceutorhynchus assimilis]